MTPFTHFHRRKRGVSLVSYGLLLGLIGIVALIAVSGTGQQVTGLFETVCTALGGDCGEDAGGETPPASEPEPEPNLPPVAGSPTLNAVFGENPVFTFAEVLVGSTDPNNDPLTIVAVSSPVNGTVELGAGSIQFVPDYGETTASFQFTIDDGNGEQDTGVATIIIDLDSDPSNIASWGRGNSSSLGHGNTSSSAEPIFTIGGHDFVSLGAGGNNGCAIDATGQAWCWGQGSSGQLGNGFNLRVDFPVPVAGDHNFSTISMGSNHACALDTAGQAWCWGSGLYLGTGAGYPDSNVPVAVQQGVLVFDDIDLGTNRSCALTSDNDVWCWGSSFGYSGGDLHVPTHIHPGEKYVEVRVGLRSTCARDSDGAIYCWGGDNDGDLGNGSDGASAVPVEVNGSRTYIALAGWRATYCAIEAVTADAYCWGAGTYGQIGNNTTSNALVPALVSNGHDFVAISAGDRHSCGIDTSGAAWCWGHQRYGRLGDGVDTNTNFLTPTLVLGGLTHSQIHAGGEFSASLTVP